MSINTTVRELVSLHAPVPDSDDAPLELSSLALVSVTEALEARFDIRVFARELLPENFQTIARICRFVEAKRP